MITLTEDRVSHVWAWVVAEKEPHHLLALFYEGTDGLLHVSWRFATRENPSQFGDERRKTFQEASKVMPPTREGIEAEITVFAEFAGRLVGAREVEVVMVESGIADAIGALGEIPGAVVSEHEVH